MTENTIVCWNCKQVIPLPPVGHVHACGQTVRGGAYFQGMEVSHEQEDVREFMIAMAQDVPDMPTALSVEVSNLRIALIMEEVMEFAAAARNNDFLGMIDALCDLDYVLKGAAVAMGVNLRPFFKEVHAADMAKLEGPVRHDGKRLKPPGWKPPNHERVWTEVYGDHPIP